MPTLDPSALRQYLRGVDPDIANEIRSRYADAVATQGAGSWTEQEAYDWLDEQLDTLGGQDVVNPESASPDARSAGNPRSGAGDSAIVRQAAQEAQERAQRVRQSYANSPGYGIDQGPVFDPDSISTSLAIGSWVDESGQPIDPRTGDPVDEPIDVTSGDLWNLIRTQNFNMGTLTMPGVKERRWKNYTPVNRAFTGTEPGTPGTRTAKLGGFNIPAPNFDMRPVLTQTRMITPSQAMSLLDNMDEDYLLGLQMQMWDAGLFAQAGEGARPEWGTADPLTRKAFQALFLEASSTPEQPINQVLARLAEKNIRNLKDVPGAPGSSSGQAPDFKPQIASKETLSQMIDQIGQDLLGHYVPDDQKQSLIKRLQSMETDTQRKQYQQDLDKYNAGSASGVPGMEDIDAFMAAIGGLESGGNYNAQNPSGASGKYQIMPSNWRPWAERAGLGPDAPRTPENQEIVARRIMMDYYAQFGNWRDVAIAWFAGPGAVGDAGAERRSDGNMTVRAYADNIMNRMAQLRTGTGGPAGGQVGGREYAPIENFDPSAEAQALIKAQDPTGWYGHQFADRATQFFNLLQGVAH